MKQFSCGDVVPGCGSVFQAEDESRLLSLARAHGRDDHGGDLSDEQEVQRAIVAA